MEAAEIKTIKESNKEVIKVFLVHETYEDVFQSGEPTEDWHFKTIRDTAQNRGKSVAVLDFRNERNLPSTGDCYIWMPMPDCEFSNALERFITIGELAEHLYSNNFILWFNCHAGISRSSAANIVFMMYALNYRRDEAYTQILKSHETAYPNEFFWETLLDLEERLFGDRKSDMIIHTEEHKSIWLP